MEQTDNSRQTEQYRELWARVQEINACWYQGRPAELSAYFHPNVVFNSPDLKHQITGKENCIQTYIDFMQNSNISHYVESNPIVQLFEKTAVVTYDFEMEYEQKGKTFREAGTDILVFEKEEDSWKVIWRALSNLKDI